MKTLLRLHECDENHTYVVVTIVPLSESSRVEESVGMARMIGARRETLTIMGPMQGLIYVFLPLSAVFLSLTLFFFPHWFRRSIAPRCMYNYLCTQDFLDYLVIWIRFVSVLHWASFSRRRQILGGMLIDFVLVCTSCVHIRSIKEVGTTCFRVMVVQGSFRASCLLSCLTNDQSLVRGVNP
jgi:hypothetical protein